MSDLIYVWRWFLMVSYVAGTMPLAAQEQALVEDLLFVLVGVDGRDIAAQPVLGRQNRSFIVDSTLDMSIKELVNRILPVASYYSTITRCVLTPARCLNTMKYYLVVIIPLFFFLVLDPQLYWGEVLLWVRPGEPRTDGCHEDLDEGVLNPGLSAGAPPAAGTSVSAEALVLHPAHHEDHGLTRLYRWEFWLHLLSTLCGWSNITFYQTFYLFFSTASSVDKGECMGGSTLSLLHDRTFNYTGDSQAQELCLYLTKAASVPYFEILEKWIYRGIIKDPYRYHFSWIKKKK